MEPMRGVNNLAPAGGQGQESPEELMAVFRAAALSVTKLYRTSTSAQRKARLDGYQDCLDDLLAFMDKESLGMNDGEGWMIRKWATEKLDGRDTGFQHTESEDETDRVESNSSPELTRTNSTTQLSTQARVDSAPPSVQPAVEEPKPIVVPTQDTFTFQSPHAYPNIATLDLSDSRPVDGSSVASTRPSKSRLNGGPGRQGPRSSLQFGQRAGSKRKLNIDEIFDLASLGGKNKDSFGSGGKRSRHA